MDRVGEFERQIFSSVSKWMGFIKRLGTPETDLERTRYQYMSIYQFTNKIILFVKNVMALPLLVISFTGTFLFGNMRQWNKAEHPKAKVVGVTTGKSHGSRIKMKDIPDELIKEFGDVFIYASPKGKTLFISGYLDKTGIELWINLLKKYPLSFYMNFSALMHLAFVGRLLKEFNPEAILTLESENDFNTSLLSKYCEKKGAEYIGVMHGETYLNPHHAFVRFSRFYVWDEAYIEHYVITGSNRDFFRVYRTNRFNMDIPKNSKKESFITYYLQGQNEAQMKRICETLQIFTKVGLKCKIRPHPRATDMGLVKRIFSSTDIEVESQDISIEKSYSTAEYIVSVYSTVLSEANENGLKAVIDDITDKTLFDQLHDIMYVNLDKISRRLSEMVGEAGEQ